jgi:hypothetical protein
MGQWGRIKTVPLPRYKGREAIKFMIQLKI